MAFLIIDYCFVLTGKGFSIGNIGTGGAAIDATPRADDLC